MQTVEVRGLRELSDALKALPKKLERRVLNASLMAGGRVIEREAKLRAPQLEQPTPRRKRGTLARNIRARVGRPDDGHNATVIVAVRKLKGKAIAAFKKATGKSGANNPDDPYYWLFVELGTSKMTARPFLRPAFEAKKIEAAFEIKDRIKRRIEKEAAKLRGWARP